MTFWRELIALVFVAFIAGTIIAMLLALGVLYVYRGADPAGLYWPINTVLACLAVLGMAWWFRR
jgi:hypothetical protein